MTPRPSRVLRPVVPAMADLLGRASLPFRRLAKLASPDRRPGGASPLSATDPRGAATTHPRLRAWVQEIAELARPHTVYWCDGSDEEHKRLCDQLVDAGTLEPLSDAKRPDSYLARSDPRDVARVEDRTFICSVRELDAGPTNNWRDPVQMRERLLTLFAGAMEGRTMYVVPFSMGPLGSNSSYIGVQLTDSAYVAASMGIMTRMGQPALDSLGDSGSFVPCVHSVGVPLTEGVQDVPWPCDPDNRYIAHFPETREIWSYGSGYGGNALLGKKCFGLRIASVIAHDEGWLAEHMLILKLTSPESAVKYVAAAFPSACGKTNLAMLVPTLPGWQVEAIGDDIAWLRFGSDGRLYAINPEAGFFGVAPGTNEHTNPNAMATIQRNALFTNCARTADGDVWWEGMTEHAPGPLVDWRGQAWMPGSDSPAAHPNARFAVSVAQCPVIASNWDDPAGVPIDALVFGGRRATVAPLVREAFDWPHGVFLAATISSENTAAADGTVGELRFDPFAMRPFCGYNMANYFDHWLEVGRRKGAKLPRIFYVNWFRRDSRGEFLWPGYGENSRVLAWIFRRCDDDARARATPIGLIPAPADLDLSGLELAPGALDALLEVDYDAVRSELKQIGDYLGQFGERLPAELHDQLAQCRCQVSGESTREHARSTRSNRLEAVSSATTSAGSPSRARFLQA